MNYVLTIAVLWLVIMEIRFHFQRQINNHVAGTLESLIAIVKRER